MLLCQTKMLPVPSSLTTSNSIFDWLRDDIWDPYSTPSISGHKCFLTFIDDYSTYTWTILMKSRSETRGRLINFITYIQTQFGIKLKFLRNDKGTKFQKHDFFQN